MSRLVMANPVWLVAVLITRREAWVCSANCRKFGIFGVFSFIGIRVQCIILVGDTLTFLGITLVGDTSAF